MKNLKYLIQLFLIIASTVFLLFVTCVIMGISIAFAGESIQAIIAAGLTLTAWVKIFLIGLIPIIVVSMVFTITFIVVEKITT